jgi:choline-sulfatase
VQFDSVNAVQLPEINRGVGSISALCLLFLLTGALTTCLAQNTEPVPVILISIDTLRADHLSAYGYTRLQTPHLDSLAQGGTLFTQAETQIPLTLPSHTVLMTSTYPFENRVEENGERVPAGAVTLASVLRARGYKTAAFIGSNFLHPSYGLDQGFDLYDCPFSLDTTTPDYPVEKPIRRDGAIVLRAARQWLENHSGQPVFVFAHLYDMHAPYAVSPEVARQKGLSRYDAELDYVDGVLGRFQEALVKSGWWDKSLVIVVSDHGEGLGDHRELDHGYYAYESTLHVPLLIHWPLTSAMGKSAYRARTDTPVGLIDVAPTILNYLGVPAPASFEGQSLLSALRPREDSRPRAVYSESIYAHDAFGWSPLRVLRSGKFKYIQAPKAELYDLAADPGENVNLIARNSAMAAELQNELATLLTRYKPDESAAASSLSPETLAQLESLGYLAAQRRGQTDNSGPDPKDRFVEFMHYQNAFEELLGGHTTAAMGGFEQILKSDPQNTLARFHLGECYLRGKHSAEALREWETTLKLDPQYAPAAESIGSYWLAQGDYAKARWRFLQVVALAPESYSGHFQLAVAEEHLGMTSDARAHFQIACKIAPEDEECKRELKSLPPN